ncbi:hypothetical protein ACROYT_G037827 [Oculina patagonica]
MRRAKIEILGVSKSRWNGSGKTRLITDETVVYNGRDDDAYMQRVTIMSRNVDASLVSWCPTKRESLVQYLTLNTPPTIQTKPTKTIATEHSEAVEREHTTRGNGSHGVGERNEYEKKDREVKRQIREDKRELPENIAQEAVEAARSQHMKAVYDFTKVTE